MLPLHRAPLAFWHIMMNPCLITACFTFTYCRQSVINFSTFCNCHNEKCDYYSLLLPKINSHCLFLHNNYLTAWQHKRITVSSVHKWWYNILFIWVFNLHFVLNKISAGTYWTPLILDGVHILQVHTHNHFTSLWILSGTTRVSLCQKKYSPTHTPIMVINHPISASSICYDPWHPPCSVYMPDSLFPQSPSFLWCTLGLAPSTLYSIHFSPNCCLLFKSRAITITTCFAVALRLCHLILVSLSILYSELYFVA